MGRPLPRPPTRPARVREGGRRRGARGVSTLHAEGARSELERRRGSWSSSGAGGDGPGRRGRRGAAPLLTTQLPAPRPGPPARPPAGAQRPQLGELLVYQTRFPPPPIPRSPGLWSVPLSPHSSAAHLPAPVTALFLSFQ